LKTNVLNIHQKIKQREKSIQDDKSELQKFKTYEAMQKAQKTTMSALNTGDSSAKKAERAKQRVKQRQNDIENQMAADEWLHEQETGADLDAKLKAAGVTESSSEVDDILSSLRD